MPQPLNVFCLCICLLMAYGCGSKAGESKRHAAAKDEEAYYHKVKTHAQLAAAFTRKKGFNTDFCFLVDMSLSSGSNRFFVYNLKKDSLEMAGNVAHGRCNKLWLTGRKYSNVVGCGCTSLGRYKIGAPYSGRFGLAYKLFGLDTTNSKAFERFVVLHAHECVPLDEVSPLQICQSDGCPTVAPAFLKKLAGKLDKSRLPVLLWIYE